MSEKIIVPVELSVREYYRVFVECDKDATNADILRIAREKAASGKCDLVREADGLALDPADFDLHRIDRDGAFTA